MCIRDSTWTDYCTGDFFEEILTFHNFVNKEILKTEVYAGTTADELKSLLSVVLRAPVEDIQLLLRSKKFSGAQTLNDFEAFVVSGATINVLLGHHGGGKKGVIKMQKTLSSSSKTKDKKLVVSAVVLDSTLLKLHRDQQTSIYKLREVGIKRLMSNMNSKKGKEFIDEIETISLTPDRFANLAMTAMVPEFSATVEKITELRDFKDALIECWKTMFMASYFRGQKHDYDGFIADVKIAIAVAEKTEEITDLSSRMSGVALG